MQAVTVGRFDQQHVGLLDGRHVTHNRVAGTADVAGENDFDFAARLRHPHFDDGGAEDVAGVAQAAAHTGLRVEFRVVGNGAQLRQARMRLRHAVERHVVIAAHPSP